MSDIPSELYRDILLRLSAQTLFPLRIVCKTWRSIIDDPSFIKSHTIKHQHSHYSKLLIKSWNDDDHLYSFPADSLNVVEGRQTIDATPINQLNYRGLPLSSPSLSCNGLIFVYQYDKSFNIWVIWNPLTREFHKLPIPSLDLRFGYDGDVLHSRSGDDPIGPWVVGFGYDNANDDYKIVRVEKGFKYGSVKMSKTLVYSLNLGRWRVSKDCPFYISPRFRCYGGVFLNGALHWISSDDEIVGFNLGTEDYFKLPGPPVPTKSPFKHLVSLSGCLALSFYNFDMKCFDGWMMKGFGVENSWVKLFSIADLCILVHLGSLLPVAYLESSSKRQVVLQHVNGFLWVDDENSCLKNVTIDELPEMSSSQFCVGSLVRLDDRGDCVSKCVSTGTSEVKGIKRKRGLNFFGEVPVERKQTQAHTRLTLHVKNVNFVDR